jgi:hypothetical protein
MTFMLIRINIVLPVILVGLCLVSTASAQRPFDKLKKGWDDVRPRGELLRKIFGEEESQNKKPSQSGQNPNAGRQPTLADPQASALAERQRAWMAQQQQLQQQQMQLQAQRQRQGQQPNPGFRPQPRPQNAQFNPPPQPPQRREQATNAAPQGISPLMAPPTKGHPLDLGMTIESSSDDDGSSGLLVKQIDSRGAAALAGILRGDLIISIGGIEARQKSDLDSIVEIMQPGDQVEFEIQRRGKTEKVMVQFGDAPDSAEASADDLELESPGAAGRIGDVTVPAPVVESIPVDRLAALPSESMLSGNLPSDGILKSVLVRDNPAHITWPTQAAAGNTHRHR